MARVIRRVIGMKRRSSDRVKHIKSKPTSSVVVGEYTGKVIPEGWREKLIEIGKPGMTIYEKKVILEEFTGKEKDIIRKKQKKRIEKNVKRIEQAKPIKSVKPVTNFHKRAKRKNGKADILFISDVEGWAWWNKSQYLKKHLSDEFNIDCIWTVGNGRSMVDKSGYDIYVTFGYSYVPFLKNIEPQKCVTGVTAHRIKGMVYPRMTECKWRHANSILLLNELKKWGLNNLFYVPNGIDIDLFRPIRDIPLDREPLIVGHIGKHTTHKKQDEILKPAIKRVGVQPFFHLNTYENKIPLEEMYKKYAELDIFVVASIEDGTPNPALEAMACERLVISNRIGNMPEIIKDGYNGFLVDMNIDAYVEKIEWCKNNRDKVIEMGKNARKVIEEGWTWTIQSENYRNMFRHIIKDQGLVLK